MPYTNKATNIQPATPLPAPVKANSKSPNLMVALAAGLGIIVGIRTAGVGVDDLLGTAGIGTIVLELKNGAAVVLGSSLSLNFSHHS